MGYAWFATGAAWTPEEIAELCNFNDVVLFKKKFQPEVPKPKLRSQSRIGYSVEKIFFFLLGL